MWIRYRKNGGQVISISNLTAAPWGDSTFFGVYEHGSDVDFSKALFCSGSTVRDATAPEIAAFLVAEAADKEADEKTKAKDLLTEAGPIGRALRAVMARAGLSTQDLKDSIDAE
jgi:hypothetical protein